MPNLTETARTLLEGKDDKDAKKADFFKKFKKGKGDKDDNDKDSDNGGDKDDDKDDGKSSDNKIAKCKKLVAAEKDVKEALSAEDKKPIEKAAKKLKAIYNSKKKVNAYEEKKEEIKEVDTNNNPDRDNAAMKKFIGQWKQLLKMDIGDEVAKNVDGVEVTGVITDFIGYDDGQVTDVVIEWNVKTEDGSPAEEIIPVEEIQALEEDAKAEYKERERETRKIEVNKKNREHGALRREDKSLENEEVIDEKSCKASSSDEHDMGKSKRSNSYARKLLDKKRKMKEDINEDETAAQDSLHPNTHPANDPKSGHDGPSRLALISKMIGATHAMSDDECIAWLTKSLAQIGHEAEKIPDGAEANRATLKTYKPDVVVTGEDVAALFDGEELSEEFKTKTSALFEAAVSAKMQIAEDKIEASFAEVLQEQMDENEKSLVETIGELNDKVEMYLDYVASEWMTENEIAVESALHTEMTASFMSGLKTLFTEHFIDIPEDAVDIVEELSAKNDELETKLDALLSEKTKLENSIKEAVADELFMEAAKGLAASQVEKFRVLAEDVSYTGDDDKFKEKLTFIREAHFKLGGGSKKTKVHLEDSFETPVNLNEDVSPEMLPFVRAISRHVPRQIDPKKLS